MTSTQPVIVSPRIAELLERGESETVEFKTRLPDPRTVARVLVAFANTRGGTLIVGVNDAGEPVGMSDDEAIRTQGRLREIATPFMSSEVSVGIVDVRGRSVVYLDVPKAPPNLSPLATAEGEFYVRHGATDQRAKAENLVRDARRIASATDTHRTPRKGGKRGKGRHPTQLFVAM
ncbi:MAG: ATP-binding protein, partial [Nitrospirota bacterium]